MKSIETPQSRCRIGMARTDITPPIGIYNRMWGAALHDCATDVHRPLLGTALWLLPLDTVAAEGMLLLALDHCILDSAEMSRLRRVVCRETQLDAGQVQICLSHTHGSGYLSRTRAALPGGDMIGPDLDALADKCALLALAAMGTSKPGMIVYGTGRCSLAAHRDYWDEDARHYVCGFNPLGPADDTVLVARLTDEDGTLLGTLVNYACHPTTLAWQNTAISPDFVGAMREVVERESGVPCLFLQGASGDLGPREGFVGDWDVADRNGRQLGFSALAALEALPSPGTRFVYSGYVMSGDRLGTWSHENVDREAQECHSHYLSRHFVVPLPYRTDLPSLQQTQRQLADCHEKELRANEADNLAELRQARAHVEQLTRQLDRLSSLPAGESYPFPVSVLRVGGALWVFVPGELYHEFQVVLRTRFQSAAIVVATLVGDWHPGYLPTASTYGRGIYQANISALDSGSLELLTAAVVREIEQLLNRSPKNNAFSPDTAPSRTALGDTALSYSA